GLAREASNQIKFVIHNPTLLADRYPHPVTRSRNALCFFQIGVGRLYPLPTQPVTPDDHSKVAPLLPIPNRTVKRLRADDSEHSFVKVGHRQALMPQTPIGYPPVGVCLCANRKHTPQHSPPTALGTATCAHHLVHDPTGLRDPLPLPGQYAVAVLTVSWP